MTKTAAPTKIQAAFENHTNVVDFARRQRSVKALKATLEQAGHQVHDGGNDDFTVTRWGMSRYCPDRAALRRFAFVLGVENVPN